MAKKIGRNVNVTDEASVTTYTTNSTTAITIASGNGERIHFSVCLAPGSVNEDVYIRYYPAATDNDKKGEVLTRRTAANNNLFRPSLSMSTDNIYTGEISAISDSGNVVIHITEY